MTPGPALNNKNSKLIIITFLLAKIPVDVTEQQLKHHVTQHMNNGGTNQILSIQIRKGKKSRPSSSSSQRRVATIQVQTTLSKKVAFSKLNKALLECNNGRSHKLHVQVESVQDDMKGPASTKRQRQKKKNDKQSKTSPLVVVEEETTTRESLLEMAKSLVPSFHFYVASDAARLERSVDREEMGRLFQEFLSANTTTTTTTTTTTNNTTTYSATERRRLEAFVMASLRQHKLLKSKRVGRATNTVVTIMTMARLTGDFPTPNERMSERERVLQQTAEREKNKNGVSVSFPEMDSVLVKVKGTFDIVFLIQCEELDQPILLSNVRISGPAKDRFRLKDGAANLLPMLFNNDSKEQSIKVVFSSTGVGFYRAAIDMTFVYKNKNKKESFVISRYVSIRSGDAKMQDVLQPKSAPYERRKIQAFDRAPKEFIRAPPTDQEGRTPNPLQKLQQRRIPPEVEQSVMNGELASAIENPDDETGTTMSTHSDDSIGGGCNDNDDTKLAVGSEAQHRTFSASKTNPSLQIVLLKAAVIFLVLCLAATSTIAVVYRKKSKESGVHKDQFDSFADKVLDTFMDIGREKMVSAGSLVLAAVAHGIDHSRKMPFITLSSFQQRSSTTKRLSGAILIQTHPIVWNEERALWENYTRYNDDNKWYKEGRAYQQDLGIDELEEQAQVETDDPELSLSGGIASHIFTIGDSAGDKAIISPTKRYYLPVWQTAPVSRRTVVNQDVAAKSRGITACLDRDAVVFEGMQTAEPGYEDSPNPTTSNMAWLLHMANGKETKYDGDIFTTVYFPIYNNFALDRTTVGVMSIIIHWARYFRGILPKQVQGIVFVLDNGCDEPYTYLINGETVIPMGHGDLHDPKYDGYERKASFREIRNIPDGTKFGLLLYQGRCPYTIRVYPSDTFQ